MATTTQQKKKKSVTASLSQRDRELGRQLGRMGIARPYLTVAALRKADVKPQTAVALLRKESGGGRNVFGHDHGQNLPDRPPYSGHPVTEKRARALYNSEFSNGVGPAQLTFKPYVARARKAGGEWLHYPNVVTGLRILRANFDGAAGGKLELAAAMYNGGPDPGADARAYGKDFMRERKRAEQELRRAGFDV